MAAMRCSSRQTSLLVELMFRTSVMSSTSTCPIRPRLTPTASVAPAAPSRMERLVPSSRKRTSPGSKRSRRSSVWTSRVSRFGTSSAMRARTSLAVGDRLDRDALGSRVVNPLERADAAPLIIVALRQRLAAEGAQAKAAPRVRLQDSLLARLQGKPLAPPLGRASTRASLKGSAALQASSVSALRVLRGRPLPLVSPLMVEANLASRDLVARAHAAVRAPLYG
jgi:hypothetical protein